MGAIAGASATILHHEVIMRVATVGRREAKQREPYHCVSPQLPSARLKKHPPVLFWVSYPCSQKLIFTKVG